MTPPNYFKNELLQNKICMEREEERWEDKAGFFWLQLAGSTHLLGSLLRRFLRRVQLVVYETVFISLPEVIHSWKLCLSGFTTRYCLYMLLAKFTILPATSNKLKYGKDLKNPVWIMVNKALHKPSANFTLHKLWKSLCSTAQVSNSLAVDRDDHSWGRRSKYIPLFFVFILLSWIGCPSTKCISIPKQRQNTNTKHKNLATWGSPKAVPFRCSSSERSLP